MPSYVIRVSWDGMISDNLKLATHLPQQMFKGDSFPACTAWSVSGNGPSPFLCVIWVLALRCGFVGVSRRSGGAEHGLFAGDIPEPGDGVGLHEFLR